MWPLRKMGAREVPVWISTGLEAKPFDNGFIMGQYRKITWKNRTRMVWSNIYSPVNVCSLLGKSPSFIEGSLEVEFPAIWTDGKAEVGRVREEKRRSEKIREEKELKKEEAGATSSSCEWGDHCNHCSHSKETQLQPPFRPFRPSVDSANSLFPPVPGYIGNAVGLWAVPFCNMVTPSTMASARAQNAFSSWRLSQIVMAVTCICTSCLLAYIPFADSLCHPWFTTTKLSYRCPFLKLQPPPCAVLLGGKSTSHCPIFNSYVKNYRKVIMWKTKLYIYIYMYTFWCMILYMAIAW